MNENTIEKIRAELASVLIGQKFGKIFTLSRFQLAIDFRLTDSKYFFVSVEPSAPRIYIIKRRIRDLEKQSKNSTSFVMFLRKRLANAVLEQFEKLENERILRLTFSARNDFGAAENYTLVVQLTGRSANLFLLDKNDFILEACRESFGAGQEIASKYAVPKRADARMPRPNNAEILSQAEHTDLSEALDFYYQNQEAEKVFQAKASQAQSKLKQEISKREKLVRKLNQDLENHGDAETWKRFGDLILANLATAKREGDKVFLNDFFDENVPTIEIGVDENASLTEAAEKFFKRYTKARNAQTELSKRLIDLHAQISDLKIQRENLEEAIAEKDESFLPEFTGEKPEKILTKSREKQTEKFKG
ncbi:MAG: NFACT family protein, partial [Acidobacteria bacterium]|nr:NFACT family protein [Acidobacteriota bacterium]